MDISMVRILLLMMIIMKLERKYMYIVRRAHRQTQVRNIRAMWK